MFLRPRLLSVNRSGASFMAAVAFALGLGIGASLEPVTASRGAAELPAAVAPARQVYVRSVPTAHPVEVLRVIDGDTFEARVHLWPGLTTTTRVRLRGIDAPELKARCAAERAAAEAARDALQVILDQGDAGIASVTLDKYGGRVVADASTHATPDVSAALLKTGLVRAYGGGRRDTWCP